VYDAFVAHVAAGRKLAPEAVRAAAEGRVWSARRAAERGLVDVLGGFEDAVKAAAAAAKLPEGVEPERLRVRARAPGGALRALLDAVRPGGRAEEGAGAGGAGAAAAAAAAVLEWIGGVGLEELGEAAALAGDGDGGGRGRAWALWPWRWTFK
jgi:ClpP class serine protease